jgi:cytochrome c
MKKIFFLLLIITIISCKKETNTTFDNNHLSVVEKVSGETLFSDNNCTACHKIDQKVVGPSLQDIAKIYKEKNGDLISFLKEESEPIVDASQYEIMRINLQVTKKMNDDELKALEEYILSQAK